MPISDYINGAVIGIAQTIVGHPLDTLKIYSQNNNLASFKPRYLMNGLRYPIISNVISNTLIFGNYDTLLKIYDNDIIKASLVTGFFNSFIINHLDYVKTHKQINNYVNPFKLSNIGLKYTILRETISTPIYFYSYHYLRHKNYSPFISGGFAGISSWLLTYKIDTFKTRQQLYPKFSFTDIYKMGGFYKGLSVCLVRAFIVNGIGFMIYDKLK